MRTISESRAGARRFSESRQRKARVTERLHGGRCMRVIGPLGTQRYCKRSTRKVQRYCYQHGGKSRRQQEVRG